MVWNVCLFDKQLLNSLHNGPTLLVLYRLIELESILLDDCNVNDIYSICQGRSIPEALRPDVWQVCLDVRHKPDQMSQFNEIYDLPFQSKLREECQSIIERIGNDDDDKVSVLSDVESILTFYCKNRNVTYDSNNGWVEVLLPLLALKLNRSDTYNMFETIREMYIPKGCKPKGNVFNVFRLLILYHDPELCSLLDTKKISPDLYSHQWFQTLFASSCSLSVVLSMWDLYFQHADPFLVFFLGLIILVNGRDQILSMKDETKENLIEFLTNMPCALETGDVVDFCSLAQYYSIKTPTTFKTDFLKILFGTQDESSSSSHPAAEHSQISQALCLPVSIHELIENSSIELPSLDAVRFFLVDCRPAEQYNAGHLPTAFHLDCNLMLQEPGSFATAVQGLLSAQKQAIEANSNAGGEHLCFMGSGRMEEDQYLYMVIASFLQKNTQYISHLTDGYNAIHDYFSDHINNYLNDHDARKCLVCCRDKLRQQPDIHKDSRNYKNDKMVMKSSSTTSELFSKFSAVMKLKSAEVKGKLMDIIVNPPNNLQTVGDTLNQMHEKHVSPLERNGKRYRDMAPVFSINDEHDDTDITKSSSQFDFALTSKNNSTTRSNKEIVTLSNYLKSSEIIKSFKCQEVHINGHMYDSYIVLTPTHLTVLRELKNNQAQIIVRRSLSSIVRITAKKRHRNLITFKYGFPEGDGLIVTDMDRFLIPNATEVTAIVSKYIVQTLDGTKFT